MAGVLQIAFLALKLTAMQLRSLCSTLAALAMVLPSHGMSQKPIVTVRFHVESNERDSDTFAMPVNLLFQRRSTHVSRVPAFSEKQITAILPFEAGDGTWGCAFQLGVQGQIRLETLSNDSRGAAMVVFVGTKGGLHQVVDMIIDRPVTDGVITIPKGLTALEVTALRKQFKDLGAVRPEPAKKKEPAYRSPDRTRADFPAKLPQKPMPAIKSRKSGEPDLPRLAD